MHLINILITIPAVGAFLWLISYAIFLWESPERLLLIFLPTCIILWALQGIQRKGIIPAGDKWNISAGTVVIVASAVIGIYFFHEYNTLLYERAANNTPTDFILSGIAMFLVIIATWKTIGSSIPTVVICFLFYAAFGKFFPGILHHMGLSWRRILMISALDIQGIFGSYPTIGFTSVIVFLFFAGMVQSFGGMEYITNFANKLLRKFRWGLPQISVITSLIFGMFSGSAAANVAADGVFNIPLMKGYGIKPATAGAIEAVASSGGQIMPPIMGVAAFLMADFLGVRYVDVVMMGFPPAILFYLFCAFSIYIHTRKTIAGLTWTTDTTKQKSGFRWSAGLPILLSLVVLMVLMEYFRMTVLLSGMMMIVTFLTASFILNLIYSKGSFSNLKQFPSKVLGGVLGGASSAVSIMLLLASMGIVARVLVSTGLGQKTAFLMVDISGGHLWLLLGLILVASVLFGMAVSTVVTYLLVVMLAAPALLKCGVPLPITHFVVFYLSLLSAITPPIAIAVAVASNIAGAPFFRTGWEAMKLGLPLFILPFLFITKPDIIAGDWNALPAFLEIGAGFMPICCALQEELRGILGNLLRIFLLALSGFGLFLPIPVVARACLIAGAVLTIILLIKKSPMPQGEEVAQRV